MGRDLTRIDPTGFTLLHISFDMEILCAAHHGYHHHSVVMKCREDPRLAERALARHKRMPLA